MQSEQKGEGKKKELLPPAFPRPATELPEPPWGGVGEPRSTETDAGRARPGAKQRLGTGRTPRAGRSELTSYGYRRRAEAAPPKRPPQISRAG